MRIVSGLLVLSLLFMGLGCTSKEEQLKKQEEETKAAAPPPPPEPTVDEIYNEMKNAISAFWRPLSGAQSLQQGEIDMGIQNLNGAKTSHQSHKNLPEAVNRLKRDIEDLIRDATKDDRWRCVVAGCLAYEALDPANTRFKKDLEKALVMLARPKVWVLGFTTVDNETYIHFRVEYRDPVKIENERARVGEEFANGIIRVEEIIGNQQGVRLNYIPVDDNNWVVPGPSELGKSPNRRMDLE